jgi:hypothetical protein
MAKTVEEMLAALSVEFPVSARKTRRGNDGKALTYIDGTTVMRRLNAATNGEWNFEIVSQEMQPFGKTSNGADRIMLTARARLTIPGLGTREHMGVQVVNATSGGEDLWKGAITDALKKAATLFGVGLELYGPDYEAGEIENNQPRQEQARPTAVPHAPKRPFNATPNAERVIGAPFVMDPHEEQDLLDRIAVANGQDDWNALIKEIDQQPTPAAREAMWLYLVGGAPNLRVLRYLHGKALAARVLTPRIAEAMNYRSTEVPDVPTPQQPRNLSIA